MATLGTKLRQPTFPKEFFPFPSNLRQLSSVGKCKEKPGTPFGVGRHASFTQKSVVKIITNMVSFIYLNLFKQFSRITEIKLCTCPPPLLPTRIAKFKFLPEIYVNAILKSNSIISLICMLDQKWFMCINSQHLINSKKASCLLQPSLSSAVLTQFSLSVPFFLLGSVHSMYIRTVSLNQSILKLHLFTSVQFDKKNWQFLSAVLSKMMIQNRSSSKKKDKFI